MDAQTIKKEETRKQEEKRKDRNKSRNYRNKVVKIMKNMHKKEEGWN